MYIYTYVCIYFISSKKLHTYIHTYIRMHVHTYVSIDCYAMYTCILVTNVRTIVLSCGSTPYFSTNVFITSIWPSIVAQWIGWISYYINYVHSLHTYEAILLLYMYIDVHTYACTHMYVYVCMYTHAHTE